LDAIVGRLAKRHHPNEDLLRRIESMAETATSRFILDTRRTESAATALLRQLGAASERVEARELEKALRRLPRLTPAEQAVLREFARALRTKLLQGPTLSLREAALRDDADTARFARRLFRLDQPLGEGLE
jgi:glutamyl-tRNA reductase